MMNQTEVYGRRSKGKKKEVSAEIAVKVHGKPSVKKEQEKRGLRGDRGKSPRKTKRKEGARKKRSPRRSR
jgi:hypothetical protein